MIFNHVDMLISQTSSEYVEMEMSIFFFGEYTIGKNKWSEDAEETHVIVQMRWINKVI